MCMHCLIGSQEVKALKLVCENLENGCGWIGELRSLEEHLSKCEYALIPCHKGCGTQTENIRVIRKDLEHHLAIDCSKRPYTCPHCNVSGEYQERMTKHLDNCPKVEVKCPNLMCNQKTLRCDLSSHRSTCEYERILCKYAEFGCEERVIRKELREHEEDDQQHNRSMRRTIAQLKKQATQQKKRIRLLCPTKPDFEIFKFQGFDAHKTDEKPFLSPPFYSNENGYKLRIEVDANGHDTGKGTHVSVFIHLLKGEHDDELTWPFTGTVEVELLNQLEDRFHCKKTGTYTEEVGKRVENGTSQPGWGWQKFILHSEVEKFSGRNCQYLKDDSLIFRVSVTLPDSKPWLESTI